jgi:hypothetical protein
LKEVSTGDVTAVAVGRGISPGIAVRVCGIGGFLEQIVDQDLILQVVRDVDDVFS